MPTKTDAAEMLRVPGLFRLWELTQILAPGVTYHLEAAGETSDGVPLLAVYYTEVIPDPGVGVRT